MQPILFQVISHGGT